MAQQKEVREFAERCGIEIDIKEPPGGLVDVSQKLQPGDRREPIAIQPGATTKEDGFVVDILTGEELNPDEFVSATSRLIGERGLYRSTRQDGRKEWVPTKPLHVLTTTSRPDHDRALRMLTNDGFDMLAIHRDFAVNQLPKEFAAACDYELVFDACHLAEGNIHHHPVLLSVDATGQLLHHKSGVGRKGLGLIGPSLIGVLRLTRGGFLPEEKGELAEKWFRKAVRNLDGAKPLDWILAEAWELRLEELACDPAYAPRFTEARNAYFEELQARRAADPAFQVGVLTKRVTGLERSLDDQRAWSDIHLGKLDAISKVLLDGDPGRIDPRTRAALTDILVGDSATIGRSLLLPTPNLWRLRASRLQEEMGMEGINVRSPDVGVS